jgi:predicted Zn-dependent protease
MVSCFVRLTRPLPTLLLAILASGLLLLGSVPSHAANDPLGDIKPDPTLTPQAERILTRLIQANNIPASKVKGIQVIESSTWNAATDGERIVFTTSLWNALQSDDQRAFVIGHELGHIQLGHVTKSGLRRAALGALDRFILDRIARNKSAQIQQAEQLALGLIDMKFSRRMEFGADEVGVQIMERARYNPQAALEAFEILKQQNTGGGPEFLRSHPMSESRIRALSQRKIPQASPGRI